MSNVVLTQYQEVPEQLYFPMHTILCLEQRDEIQIVTLELGTQYFHLLVPQHCTPGTAAVYDLYGIFVHGMRTYAYAYGYYHHHGCCCYYYYY